MLRLDNLALEGDDALAVGLELAAVGGELADEVSLLALAGCGTGCPDSAAAFLPVVGIGLGAGIGFDALTKEKKVFRLGQGSAKKLTLVPLFARDRRGLVLSLSF